MISAIAATTTTTIDVAQQRRSPVEPTPGEPTRRGVHDPVGLIAGLVDQGAVGRPVSARVPNAANVDTAAAITKIATSGPINQPN